MAKDVARRSRTEWQRIIDKQASSSLSALGYCERHAITYSSFLYWRRRLQELSPAFPPEPTFVELVAPERSISSNAPWLIEVDLAPGVQLRIARHA